ncbi:MFS transporter [Actinomyces vulturis]|uniref:MFS transporter n=1 Tax=Actinomyces vulturis TaxID=1857645 RepID=UPI00082B32EF|nr:MFS transporter [Actinomyces vulturis]
MITTQDDVSWTSRLGVLALSLVLIELISGMQVYVAATINPLIANDFNAVQSYGLLVGAGMAATFITMPMAPAITRVMGMSRAFTLLTVISIAAGLMSALAPSLGIFVVGRIISGLASGALAVVSTGAIVKFLPATMRQKVLALNNLTWVFSALIGPTYGGVVASALNWRWAMVIYLPFLLVARLVIAWQMRFIDDVEPRQSAKLPFGWALALSGSILALGLMNRAGQWVLLVAIAGIAVAFVALRRLLPNRTLRAGKTRHAALVLLGVVNMAYLGADMVITLIGHENFDYSATQITWLLSCSGLAWALTGLWTGPKPATTQRVYLMRVCTGGVLLAVCLIVMGVSMWMHWAAVFFIGWAFAGLGIGLSFLDTLNVVMSPPIENDGIDAMEISSAMLLIESVPINVVGTLLASAVGWSYAHNVPILPVVLFIFLGIVTLTMLPLSRRASSGTTALMSL